MFIATAKAHKWSKCIGLGGFSLFLLISCADNSNNIDTPQVKPSSTFQGLTIKMVVGSALGDFCQQASQSFNQQNPKLDNGTSFQLTCEAKGSGDVVNSIVNFAQQVKAGTLPADSPEIPTLISLDGEIYQGQLIFQINQIFPGQNYIPPISDSPLLAFSPMVFMAPSNLAKSLAKVDNLFQTLVTAKTHKDIDPAAQPLNIYYVQTAPTRSNSGLQTLVSQFASVSGKQPEQLTINDIKTYQGKVQAIQSKVTRYGISTNSLAKAMVQNGVFWASIASVYESSVIMANSSLQQGQTTYEAIYPKATFTSNMRAILPKANWISADEKVAAAQIIAYLQSAEAQQIATGLGLRSGTGIALGAKFIPSFGVQAQPKYESYKSPKPEVVDAMLRSWSEVAKKPSLVVVVVDSSGSMAGSKIRTAQNTLLNYINSLGVKEQVALIDFDSQIRPPVLVDGTPEGKNRGVQFVSSLNAEGGTKLYDAALYARNWLQQNLRKDGINAVLILTDGEDSGSSINIDSLGQELQKSGFSTDQRIAFFTIGYGDEGEFNPAALKKISELNGGYYSKGDPNTIAKLMADIQTEF